MYGVGVTPSRPAPKRPIRARRPIQLAALRGFVAAARRLSFTLAAEDLALTQSAISRQVATLEREVGKRLFVRKTRALALSADGERLLGAIEPALASIDACVDALRGVGQAPRISLTTYASFASLWLVPRLAEFQQAFPQIEIRIDASDRIADLAAEGLDVAIRRALPARIDADDHALLLCEEFVTPALSPHLLERSAPLRTPADLQRLPLIDMDDRWRASVAGSWQAWFRAFDVPADPAAGAKMTFSFIDQAMQAAVRGQGAVMGRTPMLEDAVAAGQLCTPFPELRMATGYSYYLMVRPERSQAPEVAAFSRWLLDQFARGPRRQT
jgi:LysR family transcriptional regulator, glycine cleavage system transcriptional activator